MAKGKRPSSPYSVIVKVPCHSRCADNKCQNCRFRKFEFVRDLLKLTTWLDKNEPEWRWFNVYLRKTGAQLESFTQNRRPLTKQLDVR